MPDETPRFDDDAHARGRGRRRFLLWLSASVFGAVAASLFTTAFKFLRPQGGAGVSGDWRPVGRVSELGGGGPLRRAVSVELRAGWSVARREEAVYVLPGEGGRVVSAVCPHEGCEVEWEPDARAFLCPCHDSRFDADGRRASGPAERDLARLPSRLNGDVLEVRLGPDGGAGAGAVSG